MADCTQLITEGITLNCDDINAPIGVDKDLLLINWDNFDREATLDVTNFEADDTNGNEAGLTNIFVNDVNLIYTFEGTDYSVQPTVGTELKDDGNAWYVHTILFTAYSKNSKARAVLEDLGWSRVVAVVRDRSTGLYELFGSDQGLKITGNDRAYVGTQTSNFYQVTIATPDVAVVRESTLGLLSVNAPVASV